MSYQFYEVLAHTIKSNESEAVFSPTSVILGLPEAKYILDNAAAFPTYRNDHIRVPFHENPLFCVDSVCREYGLDLQQGFEYLWKLTHQYAQEDSRVSNIVLSTEEVVELEEAEAAEEDNHIADQEETMLEQILTMFACKSVCVTKQLVWLKDAREVVYTITAVLSNDGCIAICGTLERVKDQLSQMLAQFEENTDEK